MRHALTDRRRRVERQLFDVYARLARARAELDVVEQQLAALEEMADEARVRMLVAETPLAEREWREAQRHAEVIARTRDAGRAEIAQLEGTRDALLAKLVG